jgi:predicted dehydrogenase
MAKPFRVAGINFDHMHMGDLLRMVHSHPEAEIVGISDEDPARMESAVAAFGISPERVYTDYAMCLEETQPDLVILCPATARHGEWTEKVAPFGTHILMEKPFAATLADADRMTAALAKTGKRLAINWPLRWYPSHVTAKRIVDEGVIGEVREVHYYDGNRGPLHHLADKIEVPEELIGEKNRSWWYQASAGGGSLLDYLGYGVTLGTWYLNGKAPLEVTSAVDQTPGLEVDEHSITVCRYDTGLSKYETRWGTTSDPWTHQPQPKCGFVLVGTRGSIASYDLEPSIRVQTKERPEGFEVPSDVLVSPHSNPIEHVIHCIREGLPFTGPLTPEVARIGQQIVDSAVLSAKEKRAVSLLP